MRPVGKKTVLAIAAMALASGWSSAAGVGALGAPLGPIAIDCDTDIGITLPEGFCGVIFADNLGPSRQVIVNDNGDVYVASTTAQGRGRRGAPPPEDQPAPFNIAALRDTDGDGKADVVERFGQHARSANGMEIYDGHLYVSTTTTVYRYRLTPGSLVPEGEAEIIVSGFPEQRQHSTKPMTFDDAGHIYVTVGGPSNTCQQEARRPGVPGQDPCPQRERQGGIWRFDAETPNQTQQDHGTHYATGIRNAVAMDWNHAVGELYALQHGRDSLSTLWPEYYTHAISAELPSEEFMMVTQGSDFGWPYCYWDHFQGKRILAPEYGGDGMQTGRCADLDEPAFAFPGHWGPNDLVFYTGTQFPEEYRGGAFIAFHGSWNRAPFPMQGYKVVFVPLDETGAAAESYEVFADGFIGAPSISSSRQAQRRPTGLAVAPDGSLYISDSRRGRIWRVVYQGTSCGALARLIQECSRFGARKAPRAPAAIWNATFYDLDIPTEKTTGLHA